MGIAHGAFCVGCCWSLMLVMFGVGLGSLALMLVLGGVTAIEKNVALGPPPDAAARGRAGPGGRLRRSPRERRRRMLTRWPRTPRIAGLTRAERRDRATADTRVGDPGRRPRPPAGGGLREPLDARASPTRPASRSARSTTTSARKRQLILAVLAAENQRLLERQRAMFDAPEPLWVRWELACDFLDDRPRVRATSGSSRR